MEETEMNAPTIVRCNFERHAEAILEIFNDAILHSTALYDYQPRTLQNMVAWFDAKRAGDFPVIGIEDSEGVLVGFGSYGTFRAWPAYKYTVEHSVYVHKDHRGRGLGRTVMLELIAAARGNDVHAMIGGIDASNAGSIALHEQLGFKHVGTLAQVGFKFGGWLDLAFYQLLLDTPAHPVDG
jgi:L-amino acid N-acyltransferase